MTYFADASNSGGSARYSGLGCGCTPRASSPRLKGYVRATLRGYRAVTLSGFGDAGPIKPGTPALIPVSDRRAVENAVRLFQGEIKGLKGFGDANQVKSSISTASTGAAIGSAVGVASTSGLVAAYASIGSIVPGIGTVIGAVVGLVAGWLMGKKKPVRASKQQVADCKKLLAEYEQMILAMPDEPIPMDRKQLEELHWCIQAVYGHQWGTKDPRWFNVGYVQFLDIAKSVVRQVYETPVGAQVVVPQKDFKDPKGRKLNIPGFEFKNPVFTSTRNLARDYMGTFYRHAAQGPANLVQRLIWDSVAWAAREALPNISEADLREASKVAQQTGTSSKDVVSAVEKIIGAKVVRDQTAELLRPGSSSEPPPKLSPTSKTPPSTAGPQVLPITEAQGTDLKNLIEQLTAQGANAQQAYTGAIQSLQAQKVPITSALDTAVATEAQASANAYMPWAIGGGLALLFLGGAYFMMRKPRRAR